MDPKSFEFVKQLVACPKCDGALVRAESKFDCSACGNSFPDTPHGQADLRLKGPKQVTLTFNVGTALTPPGFAFDLLRPKKVPEVDFGHQQSIWHFSKELLSYIPKASTPTSIALDLGCGTGVHRGLCEQAGYRWIGIDYGNPQAPVLADAHALPLMANSVDMIISMAVFEHLRNPYIAAQEAFRVLKPGGHFIGTVAFMEPFHGDSYYHHTHLGTMSTLSSAGFDVDFIAPTVNWTAFNALIVMGAMFPRLPAWIRVPLVWTVDSLNRLWWTLGVAVSGNAKPIDRFLSSTGSYQFVARKSGNPPKTRVSQK